MKLTRERLKQIIKEECYVFDFAPDRALRQIADYSCRLNVNESNPEKKVEEFIKFLPVIAYDGSSMKTLNAAGILDMAMSGTTATLLARRWESALLVNVDNNTLQRLMSNEEAMKALMSIEGFRNLNQDIENIINKSNHVKKVKKEADATGKKIPIYMIGHSFGPSVIQEYVERYPKDVEDFLLYSLSIILSISANLIASQQQSAMSS